MGTGSSVNSSRTGSRVSQIRVQTTTNESIHRNTGDSYHNDTDHNEASRPPVESSSSQHRHGSTADNRDSANRGTLGNENNNDTGTSHRTCNSGSTRPSCNSTSIRTTRDDHRGSVDSLTLNNSSNAFSNNNPPTDTSNTNHPITPVTINTANSDLDDGGSEGLTSLSELERRVEIHSRRLTIISERSSLSHPETLRPPLEPHDTSRNSAQSIQRQHGDISISLNSSHPLITTATEHVSLIRSSFDLLSKEFGVYFNIDNIISSAIVFASEPRSVLVNTGSDPSGLYIVHEGEFSYSDEDGGIIMGQLSHGEMFGEVASLMNVQNIMCIKCDERSGIVIRIPYTTITDNISGKILKTKSRSWCVRRAHIYTSGLFDPSTLILLITTSAIKSTKQFNEWSYESLEYMTRLCQMTLFNKGDALYKINDLASSYLFIIITGRLKVVSKKGSSDHVIVKDTTNSCCIGDQEFFQKVKRKHTMIAMSPVLAIPLGREVLLATVEEFTMEKEHLRLLLSSYIKKFP